MKKSIFSTKTIGALAMAGLFAFASCSSDDNSSSEPTKPVEQTKTSYALLTATLGVQPFVGYLSNYDKMPEGDLDNIHKGSLQIKGNGMKAYGEWVFQRLQLGRVSSPDDGILRYSINADGSLSETGRITGMSSNFYVHDKTTGYYADIGRGLLKIQVFNPSTMQRTGEIDLSVVEDKKAEYQAVGSRFIASKDGKLYVDIITGTKDGQGSQMKDPAPGYIKLAVIDIATGKYEKTIQDNRISYVGYGGNANQMWTMGDDGAIYMCSHGFGVNGATNGSAIVRIKKGATEIDKDWIIKIDDYVKNTTVGSVGVKDGKLYTAWSDKAFSYTDILPNPNFTYYAFDKENIAAGPKAVTGIPQSTYAFQDAQAITTIDGKVYFRVVNNKDYNGYYVLGSDNVAKPAFNIGKGGQVWGLVKLEK
ncbi:hypothetical protein [Myroides sp. C4067]|uniref:hypothetical protein n=1 Tax=Myroides sp. C4067 TaxID=3136765 RepID=UPI003101AEE9